MPPIDGLESTEPVGADAAPSPVAPKFTAARLQEADLAGEQRLSEERKTRRSHLDYFAGRWYGKNQGSGLKRPFNRLCHMVNAFASQVVPAKFSAQLSPRRAGLAGEARMLEYLIDNNLEEQNAIDTIFEPAIIDAMFSPWSTIFTGRKPGRRVLEVDAQDVDPGEPFSQFIEFDDGNVDPSAKDIRKVLWMRHKFRVPKSWLLESPAFRDKHKLIESLRVFENNGFQAGTSTAVEGMSTSENDRRDALMETVELLNFAIYDHGRIYEVTIPPKDHGPAEFLRYEPYTGADGGPYDLLAYHRVPGNLPGLSPAAIIRDIAEDVDTLARKASEQAQNSKKVLGYQDGFQEDAESIAGSEDAASVKLKDPSKVQVYDLNMVQRDMVQMLSVLDGGYQDLAGNPNLLAGTSELSNTLGQDEILNARAGARVGKMSEKVVRLASTVVRKWAYEYQQNPIGEWPTQVTIPGVGPMDVTYSAATRRGTHADFTYGVRLVSSPNANPDMQARRVNEFLQVIGNMMPMFLPNPMTGMPPMFKLRGVVTQLAPKYGIENPDEMINDIELEIERLQAEMQADQWLQRANLGAPDLAGPGVQGGNRQNGLAGIPGMGMMFPGGMGGMPPSPLQPVSGMQGHRQASR